MGWQCTPHHKLWIPSTPGHCRDEHARGVYSGSINVVSDFMILLLPIPVIVRLQMPSVKKVRPLVVFGVGLFACIAAVVRLVYSTQLEPDGDSRSYQLNIDKEGLWAFAEIAIGIIVGCMPHVHKFFRHISSEMSMPSTFKFFSGSTGSSAWRRLFSRPPTSEESSSHAKLFGSTDSRSTAPQIRSLNMTRASLGLMTEKELPALPAPTYVTEEILRKPIPSTHGDRGHTAHIAEMLPVGLLDLERQAPSGRTWKQEHESISENRRSGTRRAHYELYSNT
ncbi:MAG: hypothetical protein Q9218_001728 [Villophora microphyllina]